MSASYHLKAETPSFADVRLSRDMLRRARRVETEDRSTTCWGLRNVAKHLRIPSQHRSRQDHDVRGWRKLGGPLQHTLGNRGPADDVLFTPGVCFWSPTLNNIGNPPVEIFRRYDYTSITAARRHETAFTTPSWLRDFRRHVSSIGAKIGAPSGWTFLFPLKCFSMPIGAISPSQS
jgi:hypothetical protein